MLIATACLEPIRRQQPDWKIVFAAREVMRPLVEGHPLVDAFVAVPGPGTGGRRRILDAALGRGTLVEQIRATGAGAVVHLHPDAACQFAARSARIPRRIGYRQGAILDRLTLTEPHADRRRAGTRHESEYNFELLAPLGIETPPLTELCPSIHLDPRWLETLRDKCVAAGGAGLLPSAGPDGGSLAAGRGDYLVINPTAFSLSLRWPAERFVSLARTLREEFGRVVMVAEGADDPSVMEIRRQLADAAKAGWFIDLAGQTNLAELAWLLRHSRFLVSRNTGTAHLASAVGCPLVELFGRLEGIYGPGRWRALGSKTRWVTAAPGLERGRGESKQAFWRRCHAAIPEDAVLRAVRELVAVPEAFPSKIDLPRE